MDEWLSSPRTLALDYPSWHIIMGETVLEFCTEFSPSLANTFDVWLDCGDLLDWISMEYPRRRYESERRVVPTELLNADACRAFGLLAKAGFGGSAFVSASTDSTLVQDAAVACGNGRGALIVSVKKAGEETWTISARGIGGSVDEP